MPSLRIPGAVAVLAAALPLAACGSSNSNKPADASAASAKQAGGLEFAQCMRSHGVTNFPDPGSNGHGGVQVIARQRSGSGASLTVNGVSVAAPEFQSAMADCQKDLPNGGRPSASAIAQRKAQALQMAKCMRSHGVPNFPDPVFQTGPGGGGVRFGGAGIDPSSPAFQAAQKICQPLALKGGVPASAQVPDSSR